ncbi:hypothetical protein, conserved [Trypanosoma brucei brucei TREU927]|uniref:Kinase n=1 Tax=Trypanosoma brucei brucei (strain 927/4 GUTat10.1) TaxID=185431 RepID=Q38DG0_TRYB2|nr:hypothetical protein, conserved [Trypanosoma brucei brucei TREU927]EAN77160.1 hypothetical protein, conserved [Trypanosoma brucei brucei TREU927]
MLNICQNLSSVAKPDLIVVSGHKCNIQRGPQTSIGTPTITKRVTAWEALIYLEMLLAEDEAFAILATFVPPLVALLPPENFASDNWVYVHDPASRPLLKSIFAQLKQMSADTHGYNEVMDTTRWEIILVDVTATFHKPCVLDIKLGYVRHSPHTLPDKVERIHKRQLRRSQPIRFCGAHHQFCRQNNDIGECFELEEFTKDMGYALETEESHRRALRSFFTTASLMTTSNTNETTIIDDRHAMARSRCCRQRVQKLVDFLKGHLGQMLLERIAFVSASLLIVYDATGCCGRNVTVSEGINSMNDMVNVYLIDFSRSGDRRLHFPEEVVGFVQGLEKIIFLLS